MRVVQSKCPAAWLLLIGMAFGLPFELCAQDDPFGAPTVPAAREPAATEPAGRTAPKATQDSEGPDAPALPVKKVELPPTFMRLHLLDGDIVSGELESDSIAILTEFGTLSVPIKKIIRFEPGLNSYPKILGMITQLVDDLGSNKYEVRQSAHKQLVEMGPKIQNEIKKFDAKDNAEQKRHLDEIKKEIAKAVEDLDEEDLEDPANQPWVLNDKVVMANFTAVGKIQQESFRLKGKYGDLVIDLGDIQKAVRPVGGRSIENRSFSLNQENFVQLEWKSSGIDVEKGDSITVNAKGTLTLTPWGTNAVAGPNGTPQYGTMPNTPAIPFGALVARIGKGKYFVVGSRKKFRADANGKLQFAITMRSSYVGKSYQYPGEFDVKVKVEPGVND